MILFASIDIYSKNPKGNAKINKKPYIIFSAILSIIIVMVACSTIIVAINNNYESSKKQINSHNEKIIDQKSTQEFNKYVKKIQLSNVTISINNDNLYHISGTGDNQVKYDINVSGKPTVNKDNQLTLYRNTK